MAKLASSPDRPIPLKLLNLGTFAVFAAWLVAAVYAVTYLVSH